MHTPVHWIRRYGNIWQEYVEIYRTAVKVELVNIFDYLHPDATCRQVFDVPAADMVEPLWKKLV